MMLFQAIDELERLLSALRDEVEDTETDYLALQERLFRLMGQLQQARGRTPEEEVKLCLLLLEAQSEAIYSTPAQRNALPRLLTRAHRAARFFPAENHPLLRRLRAACARYEADLIPTSPTFIPL